MGVIEKDKYKNILEDALKVDVNVLEVTDIYVFTVVDKESVLAWEMDRTYKAGLELVQMDTHITYPNVSWWKPLRAKRQLIIAFKKRQDDGKEIQVQ